MVVALFLIMFACKLQAQSPTNDSLYIVGSATPGGWSNPIPAANLKAQTFTTVSPTDYKISVLLIGGSDYKFISQNGSWGNNWGIGKADDPTEVKGGPFSFNTLNILAPSVTGIYNIEVNFSSKIFTVALAATPKVTISSFAPTSAAAGTTVTINGVGFTGATAVSFGGTPATSFVVLSDTVLTAVVGKAASGTIQVTAPNGVGILGGFTFNTNTLFIVGAATPGAWANPIPSADSAAQQFTTVSATEYKITIPLIGGKEYKFIPQDGSWTLSYGIAIQDDPNEINGGALTTNGQNILAPAASGTYTIDVNLQTNTFTIALVSASKVTVSSFSPASADSATIDTIVGVGFTGATAVSFGGIPASSFTVVNDSMITAVVGGGASGSIQVTTPNGIASLVGFTFIPPIPANATLFIVGSATAGGWVNPVPTIGAVSQQMTAVSATEFKITIPLIGGGEYKFLPTNGSWTTTYGIAKIDDPNEVNGGAIITTNSQNILAPAVSGTYTIDVNLKTNMFTISLVAPIATTITSFTPTSADSGATVTIHGVGFTGASAVGFGLTAATSFTVVNDTTITAIVGGGASGDVIVIAPNGTADVPGFTYLVPTVPTLYIIGTATAGGWTNPIPTADSIAQLFTTVSATEYKITTHLNNGGEYKFIPTDGLWTGSYGISVQDDPTKVNGGAIVANGQNILAPALSGTYSIDVNTKTNQFTISLVSPDTLFIVGNATAGQWFNPIPSADSAAQQFTQVSPTEFKLTTWLIGDSSYKFIAQDNGNWNSNWGIAVTGDTTMIYGGTLVYGVNSKDIVAPAVSGEYIIDVNFATNSFTVTAALPVKIASFTATANNKTVIANWVTASEDNTSNFKVQHSTDGSNFTTVGTVKAIGSGSNSYQFTDVSPAEGTNYYRIQTVDNDGSYSISKSVAVQFSDNKTLLFVYPTLIHDGKVNISINEAVAGKASIKVSDLNGRILQSGLISVSVGKSVLPYKLAASSKGIYLVSVETASAKNTFKVVVE